MRLWQTAENSDLLNRSDLRIGDGISSSRGAAISAQLRGEDEREDAPDEAADGDERQQREPEPQHHVDLLVDNVQRHDAERVMHLDRPGLAVFVEAALSHLRKHHVEHVHLAGEVIVQEFRAQHVELAAQERVGEVDLEAEVEVVEELAEDHVLGERLVDLDVLVEFALDDENARVDGVAGRDDEIAAQPQLLLLQVVPRQRDHLQPLHQALDSAA